MYYPHNQYCIELFNNFILSPDTLHLPDWIREHPNVESIETKYTLDEKYFMIRFKTLLEPKDMCNLTENIIITKHFPNYELKMIDKQSDLFIEQMNKRMKSFIQKSIFRDYIDVNYTQSVYLTHDCDSKNVN